MKKLSLAAILAFSISPSSASVIFDFQELTDTNIGQITGTFADGTSFGPANSGERAFNSFDWIKGGIKLTASATYTGSGTYGSSYLTAYSKDDPLKAWAYLDAGNAGLGVCSKGLDTDSKGTNQCHPGNDDNVTVDEVLNILFDQTVSVDFSQSLFRDADHKKYSPPSPSIKVSVDGGAFVGLDVTSMLTGADFRFLTESDTEQFYIDALTVSNVPEPSVLALFGLGLAGLGVARRRYQKA